MLLSCIFRVTYANRGSNQLIGTRKSKVLINFSPACSGHLLEVVLEMMSYKNLASSLQYPRWTDAHSYFSGSPKRKGYWGHRRLLRKIIRSSHNKWALALVQPKS